ncbi:MAG: 50S ribosomal protein L27 [Candidatus Omnitrophota bacterium]|jgi:ribosomal protein L27
MIGGFSTPKKDKMIKVSGGQEVRAGQILIRRMNTYRAGRNVNGIATLQAICDGKVYFTKKKTPHGKPRTFINVMPQEKKTPRKSS